MDTLIKRARYNYAKLEYAKSVGMFTVNYRKSLSKELIKEVKFDPFVIGDERYEYDALIKRARMNQARIEYIKELSK